MAPWNKTTWLSSTLALSMCVLLICAAVQIPTTWAQANGGELRLVRIIDNEDLFTDDFFVGDQPRPLLSGVAFPPGANILLMPSTQAGGVGSVVLLAPPSNANGQVSRQAFVVSDLINVAFDGSNEGAEGQGLFRLFLFDNATAQLTAFKANAQNVFDPTTATQFDTQQFGITDPQGMAFDATADNGRLFILDPTAGGIMQIDAALGRDFDGATALQQGRISQIILPAGLSDLRGIAFNPSTGQLFVFSPSAESLYAISLTGELTATMSLPGFQTEDVQGVFIGPSLDLTDDPSIFHLYVAANQGPNRGITEWELPASVGTQ
jgi:hypothetical protein